MIIDCVGIKEKEIEKLKNRVEKLSNKPKLDIIIVGNDYASNIYVKKKIELANYLNIETEIHKLDEDINDNMLIGLINALNKNDSVDGILLQLPLPSHLDEENISNKISPLKDVDGFTYENMGRLIRNGNIISACTPQGIMNIIDNLNIELEGKNVLIASRSNIVGKPLALMMINKGATTIVANSKTKNIKELIGQSDIFISAIGQAKYFDDSFFIKSKDLIVIDVGINKDESQNLCGDIDIEKVEPLVQAITPVPNGVGPLTVVEVMKNMIKIKENK